MKLTSSSLPLSLSSSSSDDLLSRGSRLHGFGMQKALIIWHISAMNAQARYISHISQILSLSLTCDAINNSDALAERQRFSRGDFDRFCSVRVCVCVYLFQD